MRAGCRDALEGVGGRGEGRMRMRGRVGSGRWMEQMRRGGSREDQRAKDGKEEEEGGEGWGQRQMAKGWRGERETNAP